MSREDNLLNNASGVDSQKEREIVKFIDDPIFKHMTDAREKLKLALANKDEVNITKYTNELEKLDAQARKANPTIFSSDCEFNKFRDPKNLSEESIYDIPEEAEEENEIAENACAVAPGRNLIKPAVFNIINNNKASEYQETQSSGPSFSTPLNNKQKTFEKDFLNSLPNISELASNQQIENSPINIFNFPDKLTVENAAPILRQQLKEDVKPEILDSYFENQENLEELNKSVQQGKGFFDVLKDIRERIAIFTGIKKESDKLAEIKEERTQSSKTGTLKKQESTTNTRKEDKHLNTIKNYKQESSPSENNLSGNNTASGGIQENSSEMARVLGPVRGISIKDALDLIPRYNGQNVSLSQFLDGCNEAKNIIPEECEGELAKLVRMRLYGEALASTQGYIFETIREVCEFFESSFGQAKTFHELYGELATVKQKPNEQVIIFLNRLRGVEREIHKAALREKRSENGNDFKKNLEQDCVKFFLRGLRWEIRARMGKPTTLKEAREEALEIEREFACSVLEDESNTRQKEELKNRQSRETKKINLVEPSSDKIVCQYCNKSGHGAADCWGLIALHAQRQEIRGNPRNNYNNNNFRPQFTRSFQNNFNGWNAGNRGRNEFLPRNNNNNSNGNNTNFNSNFNNNFRNNSNGNRENFSNYYGRGNNFISRNSPNQFNQGGFRGNNSNRGNNGSNNRFAPSNQFSNNSNFGREIVCYNCGRSGHVRRECSELYSQAASRQGNSNTLSLAGAKSGDMENRRPATMTGSAGTAGIDVSRQ